MSRHWLLVMARLQIILFVVLPLCSGQFSIQGPSDGNRRAQGLKYSREKGIEYEDQRASLGGGDFSIQGASDGNSDFKIQGASDGNSDFQIQGATDGNANFQIQGATDGNANFHIQGATDSNANFQIQGPTAANVNYQHQGAPQEYSQPAIQQNYQANPAGDRQGSLQYKDPSGLKVNWQSYHQLSPEVQASRNAFVPHDAPIPRRRQQAQRQQAYQQPAQPRQRPAQAHQQQAQAAQQPAAPAPNYRSYDVAPAQIKQLLQFQQMIPYLNIIPEQYRYDGANVQVEQGPIVEPNNYRKPQKPAARAQQDEQPEYRPRYSAKARGQSRQKRQVHQRQARQQQHQQQRPQHQQAQPPVEAQPQYSTNVPSGIQNILKFQAQIPYVNHIPEKWRYDALAAAQSQKQEFTSQYQNQQYQRPQQAQNEQGGHRQKRQAPQHQQSQIRQFGQHQQQQQQQHQQQQPVRQQPQYQRISQPPPEAQPHYSTNVPAQLQQLLKFQSQIPYINSIPEQFRYENLAAAQSQHGGQAQAAPAQYQPQYQQGGHAGARQKRQAPQYQQQQQQQQPQKQPQYQRISQPPAEAQPQYSTSVPAPIQKLLQFQAQTPYNIIANQIIYRPDKPYVPQPIQSAQSAAPQQSQYQRPLQPQYQQPQQSQYQQPLKPQYQQSQQSQYQQSLQSQIQKPQQSQYLAQSAYQGQGQAAYGQGQATYSQAQAAYGQAPGGVRPVTEKQY